MRLLRPLQCEAQRLRSLNCKSLQIVVGNTYCPVPETRAEESRCGKYKKTHSWELVAKIVPDLKSAGSLSYKSAIEAQSTECRIIQKVSFRLHDTFLNPLVTTKSELNPFHVSSTHQTSYGYFNAGIEIHMVDGTTRTLQHKLVLKAGGAQSVFNIEEPVPLSCRNFGVELELVSSKHHDGSELEHADIKNRIFGGVLELHGDTSCWELAHDSSIECNSDQQAFELVSPKLTLDSMGLTKLDAVVSRSQSVLPGLCVNADAGFHVHVDISDVSLDEIKRICAQFVKFEDVMDRFMPQSRRGNNNKYGLSNRYNKILHKLSNEECNERILSCSTLNELGNVMNPTTQDGNKRSSRYYKLNLQNVIWNRQPTLEFRQHSGTHNSTKIAKWIQFLLEFVDSSIRQANPDNFKNERNPEFKQKKLFQWLVTDKHVKKFYAVRAQELISPSVGWNDPE